MFDHMEEMKYGSVTREVLLDTLKAFVMDTEENAWCGFSTSSDIDATWRARFAVECKSWSDLIARGRRTLEEAGVVVPTPLQVREENEWLREEERRREAADRKQRLDAKRCRHCGLAKGHKSKCPKHKKNTSAK